MQSYACKEIGKNIIYLSTMHITERPIIGYDISDTHPRLANLQGLERVEARVLLQGEIKYRKGQYILKAMKKIQGNGCILAAHKFG
jgi:hypothetical protein